MTRYFLGHRDGWLCLVLESIGYGKPQKERSYYPIQQCTAGQALPLIGSPCKPHSAGDGCYIARVKGGTMDVGLDHPVQLPDYDQTIVLTDGGRTMPIAEETEPIPCPKVKKGTETRWKYPGWQKCTKTKGWVSA